MLNPPKISGLWPECSPNEAGSRGAKSSSPPGINQELGLQLARSEEEYLIEGKKNEVYPHVMYEYHSEDDRIDYYLIKNKQNGSTLILEKPSIDYFLFVNNGVYSLDELIGKLRKVESVLGVYPFEPEMIDSAEKLVFG